MALRPSPCASLFKAMIFCCSRFHNNHTISSLTHQNDINITLTQLCREGRLKQAMDILLVTNTDIHHSLCFSTCLQLLQTCITNNALPEGKLLNLVINRIGLQFDMSTHKFLQDKLIHMYVNCGSLAEAREVFDCMTERDIFSWNLMISGYQRHGFLRQALTLFYQMQQTAAVVQPDQFTFPIVLKACTKLGDLQQGLYIHQRLFKSGFLSHVVVVTALVDLYAKFRSVEKARELFDKMHDADTVSWNAMISGYAQNRYVEKAREVFDKMPHRNAVSWNAVIAGYAQNGLAEKALETFKEMQLSGVKADSATFASILPACATMGALEEGVDIHHTVLENGFSSTTVVVNALIDMYAKCGRIHKAQELFDKMHDADTVSWNAMIAGYGQNGYVERARELFDRMPHRNTVSWNAMIAGYTQNRFSEKALETFKQMQLSGVKPNSATFASILPAFATMGALEEGMEIHQRVVEHGFSSTVVVLNALIDMYAKCGRIHTAQELFDKMHDADTVSWTAMIAGYTQYGFSEKALEMFKQMQLSGVKPNSVTFASILPACATMGAVEEGMDIHQRLVENGFASNVVVVSALIDMYAKCGRIHKATELFDKMHDANPVSWNAMISGYVQNGYVERARELFDKMAHRNAVSWNAMIAGYAQNGLSEKALETFKQMQLSGLNPNLATFASILPACATMGALEEGMDIHQTVVQTGLSSNVVVMNALIAMYAKCGRIHKAQQLFDKMQDTDTVSWTAMISGHAQSGYVGRARELFDKMFHQNAVSWNAMIAGYAQNGFSEKSLETFKQMQLSGVKPDSATFASILPACATMGALEEGMDIHQTIVENGFMSNVVVVNSLIAMYAKCGRIHKARELFEKMHDADTVSWTAIIVGYAQNGFFEKALETFKQMQLSGVKPDSATFASILPACATMGALEEGMDTHQRVVQNGFASNVLVVSALIDMYAKCGRIYKARELFDRMHDANPVSWNPMIGGYAIHGYSKDALKLFDMMKQLGTKPNSITFVCVLLACSHAGLVDEGCKYFNSLSAFYCIIPGMNHYTCIVDLLGRAGYLEEALNFIAKMPAKPESSMWMCLLGACRSHKNVGIGEFVATILFLLEPKCAPSYVLLSNIYAELGSWVDVQRVRTLMEDRGIKKTPGCSWIEVDKRLHAFLVGDR